MSFVNGPPNMPHNFLEDMWNGILSVQEDKFRKAKTQKSYFSGQFRIPATKGISNIPSKVYIWYIKSSEKIPLNK